LKTNGTSLEVPFFLPGIGLEPRAGFGTVCHDLWTSVGSIGGGRLRFQKYGQLIRQRHEELHWTIATFFLLSYCSAYYSIWFTVDGTVANDIAVQIHITSGILVAGLILVRIYWRLTGTLPAPPAGEWYEHLAARVSHGSL